ncbi:cobalamin biosynthesis protein [Oscillatoria sp. FACHB-1406]|nr:cobalamin biosynthesis protein [Oscillatoria sp. FACHB-1406]
MHCQLSIILAALLDYLIGDPWGWPHPVRAMGYAIARVSDFILRQRWNPQQQRFAGVILGVGIIGGSGLVAWLAILAAKAIHPIVGVGVSAIALASCFAGRSLRDAAFDVLQPLESGDLESARLRLSLYVGRDTEHLSEAEILRAVLETVAENAVDGVTAPLFYAIIGMLVPGVGSVPLAIAYKAASTLDSMVGYKKDPYTHLGWFSARFEDYLTWWPCRFTVAAIALLSGKPGRVWQLCRRDANQDPSPNSGWSECAYAAALGVQLGGRNVYGGVVKDKPLLGNRDRAISPQVIKDALKLTRHCFLLGLAIGSLLILN